MAYAERWKENLPMTKKRFGLFIDILMFILLIMQMFYIFTGNNLHEILGIAFFVCLVIHVILKKWWFKSILRKDKESNPSRTLFNVVTGAMILVFLLLMFSSMGVSRFLFPWFHFFGSAEIHRYLATALLTLSIWHGSFYVIRHVKRKRKAKIFTAIVCAGSVALGLYYVPYMNRHLRKVEISSQDKVVGEKVEWKGETPLVVYFTRLGNTDFAPNIDAVSGASLLISDNELKGSNQLLAEMLEDIIGSESVAITLTGEKYPSSYNDTINVAGKELRAMARPSIEPIDVTAYDSIILIYPLWWNSIPMPVATFLEENEFTDKTIYLIATQGSSGYGKTIREIRDLCPNAKLIVGTSIYCEDIVDARTELVELVKKWNE